MKEVVEGGFSVFEVGISVKRTNLLIEEKGDILHHDNSRPHLTQLTEDLVGKITSSFIFL